MSDITATTDVQVPVRTAYNQWTQFEEFPSFMAGVVAVRQLDPTHLHWEAEIDGVRREWDAEITEQLPDQRIAWKATDGTANAGVVTFHRLGDDETRIALQLEVDPQNLTETIGDRLGFIRRQARSDLERFKDLVESRGVASGAWRGTVER